MRSQRVRERIVRGAIAILCVPIAVAYAFAVYDAGSGSGSTRARKRLRLASLVLPILVALVVIVWRDLKRQGDGTAAPAASPRIRGASLTTLFVLLTALFTLSVDRRQPPAPGPFYDPPSPLPDGPPGMLLRSEPLPGAPPGARAWKILYRSTRYDGTPTAVSGTLVIPDAPPPAGGRPVVAWGHPTAGVVRNCAPSLRAHWAERITGLSLLLRQGYTVVATDFEGLGTGGVHGYLVGEAAANNILDGVRAAHNIAAAEVGTRFAVWGASQGGHAALFTGEFVASYAPELTLVGVAAAAPPTDLTALLDHNLGTDFANVLGAFTFASWAETYPDATLEQIVTPLARPIVRNIASYCFFEEKERYSIVPGALLIRLAFLSHHPTDVEPWKRLFARNSLGHHRIPAPILIAQGEEDQIICPDVTRAYVARIRAAGDTVEYRGYPGVGHVPTAAAAMRDVVAWINDQFRADCNSSPPAASPSP